MNLDVSSLIAGEIESAERWELEAYLAGAAHDATFSRRHQTMRFCQAGREWVDVLSEILGRVGKRAWIYKEGATRACWVVESTWRPKAERRVNHPEAYCRGYFDAEGGIPRDSAARFYIQLVQKDLADLHALREMMIGLGLECGSLHNPSARVDPNYWRFYVLAESHAMFCRRVSSWQPRKRSLIEARLAQFNRQPSTLIEE